MALFPLNSAGTAVFYDFTAPIVGYAAGLPYCANGALAAQSALPTSWVNGIPIAPLGRVAFGAAAAVAWHQGLPLTTDGRIATALTAVSYYSNGLPYASNGRLAVVEAFNPVQLFASGEIGAWYDPSDMATLFQDSAGTTPVTAVEQPVGRMLDKSGRAIHAVQATAAARPVFSARQNLLTKSEDLTDAVWPTTNATVTSDTLTDDATVGQHQVTQSITVTATLAYTLSAEFEAMTGRYARLSLGGAAMTFAATHIDLQTGTILAGAGVAEKLGPTRWRVSLTSTATTTGNGAFAVGQSNAAGSTYAGTGTTIRIQRLQLVPGSSYLRYQRVNTATDYDSAGFLTYLAFDGSNDLLAAASIVPGGATVCFASVALQKMGEVAFSNMLSLTDSPGSTAGSFNMAAPNAVPPALNYAAGLRGATASITATPANGQYPAPVRNVVTALYDFAGTGTGSSAQSRLRVNGANISGNSGAGVGPFVTGSLNVGRSGNGSAPCLGRYYGSVVRFGALPTAQQIMDTESFLASKVGITFTPVSP